MKRYLWLLCAGLLAWVALALAQVDKSISISKVSDTAKFVMQDGTVISGKLELKNLDLVTAYGQLAIPVTDIVRVRFARKADPELRQRIARLVADLGSPDFNTRDRAMVELTKIGRKALAELEQACLSDDPEVRLRATKIMESIRVDDEEEVSLEEDEVVTRTLTLRGNLKHDTFSIQTQFGPLRAAKTSMVSMTANIEEFTKQCRLNGNFVTAKGFLDTKLQVRRGDRLDFVATGQIYYPSTQQSFTPDGKPEAGLWQNIPMGAVVARIGTSGPVFKVGDKLSLRADVDGTLFLAFAHNVHDPNATGWFKVQITHQPAPVSETR